MFFAWGGGGRGGLDAMLGLFYRGRFIERGVNRVGALGCGMLGITLVHLSFRSRKYRLSSSESDGNAY